MDREMLKAQLSQDVEQIIKEYEKLRMPCGRLRQMFYHHHNRDGYETAKQILKNDAPDNIVFGPLRRKNLLNKLAVESLVVDAKYKTLFDASQIEIAKFRLKYWE
jgi:hypothetical protein